MTNGDKIRSMTNEQLANFILDISCHCNEVGYYSEYDPDICRVHHCPFYAYAKERGCDNESFMNWLNEGVGENAVD